ncbi:MAG: hypothetical protein WBD20_27180 [Pirellulaceae bacterium]
MKNVFQIALLGFTLTITGCSGGSNNTYAVSGIVRFPDGKLLRDGTVEFELIGDENAATATGEIGPDGSFTLGTFTADDGALAGNHRVAVISDVEIGTGAERPGMIAKSQLDQKYRDFRTSDLEFTVKPGRNNFIVEVDYAPSEE